MIVPTFRKVCHTMCSKHRGISSSSVVSKLLVSVILRRLSFFVNFSAVKIKLGSTLVVVARIRSQPWVSCLNRVTFTKSRTSSCSWISGRPLISPTGQSYESRYWRTKCPRSTFPFRGLYQQTSDKGASAWATSPVLYCLERSSVPYLKAFRRYCELWSGSQVCWLELWWRRRLVGRRHSNYPSCFIPLGRRSHRVWGALYFL